LTRITRMVEKNIYISKMKREIAIILLLCIFTCSFAQQEPKSISFEPYIGLSISNLTDADMDSKVGIATGVNMQYQCCDKWGVVTGLGYSNYGAKHGDASLTLGYLELPIMAKYYIYKGLALSSGVQFGLNVCDGRTQFILLSEAYKCALGIPVGISYDFKRMAVNAQYYIGFTKTYKYLDYKNRGIKITLGYKI